MKAAINLDRRQCTQCLQPALPLIRLGESVLDDESPYCESMMLHACRTGNLGNLKMLREDEALAKRTYRSALTDHPVHPLAVAIIYGHTDCVQALIDSHADANTTDKKGRTPLHIAAAKSRTKCLKKLIKTGGVNINIADKFGWTALHLAARYASAETVMALLGAGGIKVNEKTKEPGKSVLPALSIGANCVIPAPDKPCQISITSKGTRGLTSAS
ncbi:ankyrin repeat domain-containing protein [Endozoicomonas sp. YOMI1]|uniref:ankyrin repeat domain-containing protein n=1 Tax=Endozoicomonas sp. YOMI1 TaxID=2828739 RepID=UPI002148E066|nr:ankyrin repeat domain-containing protein [Endozoicomonas sp. YOMI1]